MDGRGIIAVIFLVLIIPEGSDGSIFENFRILAGTVSHDNSSAKEFPPSPSPVSGVNDTTNLSDGDKSSLQNPKVPKTTSKTNQSDSLNEAPQSPQAGNQANKSNDQTKTDKSDDPIGSKPASVQTCDKSSEKCEVQKMMACIRRHERGSPELCLLVQNKGESTLIANVTVPASVNIGVKEIEVAKHQAKMINFSANLQEGFTMVLKTASGNCTLHKGPLVPEGSIFQQFPSYATRVTPIYGAYVLFLVALIVGGTCACCKLRKRGRLGEVGIPYQELEMAQPESVLAANVDSADGWDQGWDDDWDEEMAVKSPGGQQLGNVSANGLTSRSSNRDGWEHDLAD